ncbi:MAG: NADH-quinone oxidoreductase subunit C [Bacillota bacterium]|nr:NADH-quinone oxidoreductase subunit C [Bacillota bacterium]
MAEQKTTQEIEQKISEQLAAEQEPMVSGEDLSRERAAIAPFFEPFPILEGKLKIQRQQRIFCDPLPRKQFEQVFAFAHQQAGFTTFHIVIGVDGGDDLIFVYILSNADKIVLLLKQSVPKSKPVISSVCGVFPNALWHERELVDLFGAVVEDLPPGPSYPLPDGWPAGNYPLRKEWKVEYFDKVNMTYDPPQREEGANE